MPSDHSLGTMAGGLLLSSEFKPLLKETMVDWALKSCLHSVHLAVTLCRTMKMTSLMFTDVLSLLKM